MTELPIKSQGFPQVLTQLGVQSPLSGPFWAFSPTVLPIYVVGNSAVQQGTTFAYPLANISSNVNVNPLVNAQLALSGGLEAGRYAVRIDWAWDNNAASGPFLFFNVNSSAPAILRSLIIESIGPSTSTHEKGSGWREFVEDMNQGDFFDVTNDTALTGKIGVSMRWTRILPLDFSS